MDKPDGKPFEGSTAAPLLMAGDDDNVRESGGDNRARDAAQ
jgi:hypothetical protein